MSTAPRRSVPMVEDIPLIWHAVIPGRPPEGFGLFIPEDPNSILENFDEEEFFATDERMPYFSTLWPAAEAMVQEVWQAEHWHGRRVLDLGCGVGAVGLAAARRGAQVTFLDWEPRALSIVRFSAQTLRVPVERTVVADWREPPPLPPFDWILAADVLYEERNLPGVCQFLARHLKNDGTAWITDPARKHAGMLPGMAQTAGLRTDVTSLAERMNRWVLRHA